MQTNKRRNGVFRAIAVGAVGALLLAGCAEDGGSGGSGGGGEGVAAGATKEQYQKAFEDVDTITLRTQTPAPKGSATGLPSEKYYEAVTDWSGGKIKWDIAYSNAVAPAGEAVNALTDGRLDVANVLPIYEPSEWPANTSLIETGFISSQTSVVGSLQSNAWPNEVAFSNEDVMNEFDDHGLVPLVPVFNSGAQGIFCADKRTSLSQFKGASVTASGITQGEQLKALGASPVSIAYPEIFESLQRGVVDCSNSSLTVGVLGGFIPQAPNLTISSANGFALAPGAMAIGKDQWESMPLVARQLLWDKLDVFVASNIEDKIWPNNAEAAKQIRDNKGSISEFDAEATAALKAVNDKLLASLAKNAKGIEDPAALVEDSKTAAAKWLETVKALGFEDIGYADFDKNFTEDQAAMDKYRDALFNDIWSQRRPS